MSVDLKFIRRDPDASSDEGPDDPGELFVVVAEWANQGPIVMETEGPLTSYEAARARADYMGANPKMLRVCIARLVYETGNALILHDLKRMQKGGAA